MLTSKKTVSDSEYGMEIGKDSNTSIHFIYRRYCINNRVSISHFSITLFTSLSLSNSIHFNSNKYKTIIYFRIDNKIGLPYQLFHHNTCKN